MTTAVENASLILFNVSKLIHEARLGLDTNCKLMRCRLPGRIERLRRVCYISLFAVHGRSEDFWLVCEMRELQG